MLIRALRGAWLSGSGVTALSRHHSAHLPRYAQLYQGSGATRSASSKAEKDALFLRALQVYYQREGHFSVPHDFVVPSRDVSNEELSSGAQASADAELEWPEEVWGMDLGRRLRLFTRGRCGEYKRNMLKSIGFPYEDWRTYVWEQQILPALHTYKELEGHLFVRQGFDVPSNDPRWPRSTWEFKLGSHCQLLRREKEQTMPKDQIETLDKLQFIWSEADWKWKAHVLPALRVFNEIYGHCHVPPRFVVPTGDAKWPETSWGYKLGSMLTQVRPHNRQKVAQDTAEELQAEDIENAYENADIAWKERMLPSLETYVRMNGTTAIPLDFNVPHEEPWPALAWGMPLGYVVHNICKHGIFAEFAQRDKVRIKSLGYRWDFLLGKWSKQLLPVLKRFNELFDHCDVPQLFVVPVQDDAWPEEMWGYKLGKQVSLMRRNGSDAPDVLDALDELDAMGFSFNVIESAFVDKVLPALEVYSELHGNCNVPQGFIVPSDEPWPKRSWGMKLGHVVRNMRSRKQHADQVEAFRDRLAELGFHWRLHQSVETTNREVVTPYIEIFKQIYGEDEEIPRDFVIPPDDDRWPDEAKMFQLGDWIFKYRQRSAGLLPFQTREGRLASQMRQRRQRSPQGLSPHQEAYWKDVLLASFQAYASLHGGSCSGMDDDFVVPRQPPFPQAAAGLNLGLRLRHLRHGERYAEEIAKYRQALVDLGILLPVDDKKDKKQATIKQAQ